MAVGRQPWSSPVLVWPENASRGIKGMCKVGSSTNFPTETSPWRDRTQSAQSARADGTNRLRCNPTASPVLSVSLSGQILIPRDATPGQHGGIFVFIVRVSGPSGLVGGMGPVAGRSQGSPSPRFFSQFIQCGANHVDHIAGLETQFRARRFLHVMTAVALGCLQPT